MTAVPGFGGGFYTTPVGGGGGGTVDLRAPTIIVGNSTHGDTLDDCDFLDPGDGTGIAAALAASAFLDDVYIRGGNYTLGVGVGPLVVPSGVAVRGGGAAAALIISAVSGDQGIFSLGVGCRLEGLTLNYNTFGSVAGPYVGSNALIDVPTGNGAEIVNCAITGNGPPQNAGVPAIDTVVQFGSDNGSRVVNCRIQQASFFSAGVSLTAIRVGMAGSFVNQSIISDNMISGCDIGISFEESRGGVVDSCMLTEIENIGIQHLVTGNEGGAGTHGIMISGVGIDHSPTTAQLKIGVLMQAAAAATIRNPHITGLQVESGNLSNPAGSIGVHLDPNGGDIEEAQIASAYVGEYATGVLVAAGCSDTVINGGTFLLCTTQISDLGTRTTSGLLRGGAVLLWGNQNVANSTTTRFLEPFFDDAQAPTAANQYIVPRDGLLRNMHVLHNVAAGNGNTIVYTLRVNGVATALTVSLASTATSGSDVANAVAVSEGDLLDIEVTKALAIGASPTDINVTCALD